jgi:hypothetical protein
MSLKFIITNPPLGRPYPLPLTHPLHPSSQSTTPPRRHRPTAPPTHLTPETD